ncbi:MAG: hypothetical protein ACREBZ_07225 [Thermoplasmata archaeon]
MLNDPGSLVREPHRHTCTTKCGRPLHVLKTVTRTVVDAGGPLPLNEVFRYCPVHPHRVYAPEPLTPPKSRYTFDLIARVGQHRFLGHQQFTEIHEELAERGSRIPVRSLQRLADRYALYTAAAHLESLPLLAAKLAEQGGYVLLVDGTGTAGRMTLQLTDGWSKRVLLSATVRSESEEELIPVLRRLERLLGRPAAAVRDMSKGIDKALREVWPDLLILTCHMHFLRAEGLKLFDRLFPRFRLTVNRRGVKVRLRSLRQRLRKRHGPSREARQTLTWVEQILEYPKAGDGLSYPFFLGEVELYRRCEKVWGEVRATLARPGRRATGAPYRKLEAILGRLFLPRPGQRQLAEECDRLEERWAWFQRLRRVLRFRNGPIPLDTERRLSETELEKGRRRLDWFVVQVEQVPGSERRLKKDLRKTAEDLEARREELFAPNVEVRVEGRRAVRPVPRTTAWAEGEFRKLRRHGRRIRGNAEVEALVQREGPGLLLMDNLRDAKYIRLVYGSLARQGARFAKVDPEAMAAAKSITGLSG